MWPLLGSLVTGGASLLGSIFSSNTSASNTQQQIAANQQMVQQQEAFQERMSSTAYQRASQDMQAAGLNPMMMFGSGGPASTPSGASIPQTVNKKSAMADLGENVGKAVNSAISAKTFEKMTEEIANLKTERAKREAETVTESEKPGLLRAETGLTEQRTETEKKETAGRELENIQKGLSMPRFRVSAREFGDIEKMPDWLRALVAQGAYVGGKTSQALSPVVDLASSASRVGRLFPNGTRYNRDRSFEEFWREFGPR